MSPDQRRMKKYFYVYYSYEEYGRGYIGSRISDCLPEEDVTYFGSYRDNTFNPTQKIVLETFDNVEDAIEAECVLHNFYNVDKNLHFANKAQQTSKKFYYRAFGENNPSKRSEVRDKIRLSMIGDNNPAKRPEVREKLSIARKERITTEETRRKMSESHKGQPGTYGMMGKRHSEETKMKMRETWRKKKETRA